MHESQLREQIGLKWKDLARERGFLQSSVNMGEEEKRHITKDCCIERLVQWIHLECVERKNVAENLISGKQERADYFCFLSDYVRKHII